MLFRRRRAVARDLLAQLRARVMWRISISITLLWTLESVGEGKMTSGQWRGRSAHGEGVGGGKYRWHRHYHRRQVYLTNTVSLFCWPISGAPCSQEILSGANEPVNLHERTIGGRCFGTRKTSDPRHLAYVSSRMYHERFAGKKQMLIKYLEVPLCS